MYCLYVAGFLCVFVAVVCGGMWVRLTDLCRSRRIFLCKKIIDVDTRYSPTHALKLVLRILPTLFVFKSLVASRLASSTATDLTHELSRCV